MQKNLLTVWYNNVEKIDLHFKIKSNYKYMIKLCRKIKSPVALTLALTLIGEVIMPYNALASTSKISMASSPVAASASSMVDGYTGDFKYSVPLLTVPGPNGESVPISAGYHAGIGVNQKASWIGLGWDYNPGEISRSVVGTPDDYNGRFINNVMYSGIIQKKLMFGSIYSKNINQAQSFYSSGTYFGALKSNDFYTVFRHLPEQVKQSMFSSAGLGSLYYSSPYDTKGYQYRFNRYSIPFQAQAYDDYSVSGELTGQLHPFNLDQNYFHSDRSMTDNSLTINNKQVQFYYANSSNQTVDPMNYSNGGFVNQTNNRVHSGMFVRYYTNAEINDNSKLFDNTTQKGFLDYQILSSGTRRAASEHDPDAIGAFEVTDPSGITYHYSLPVYSLSESAFEADYKDLQSLSDWGSEYRYILPYNELVKNDKYATSWKLTAITGADYQDLNNNKIADEGDAGYWIRYNYSLWSNDYYSAFPRFDYRVDGSVARNTPSYSSYFNGKTFVPNVYKKTSNISKGHSQVYVLNYIQTASHTAFFVKSVRLDEQSYDNLVNSSVLPTPLLKLDRIVLLRNEDKGLLINGTSMSSVDKDSRFSYATCTPALNDPDFIHVTKYNLQANVIKTKALKMVEFITDYSLARKYTSNINTTVSIKPVKNNAGANFLFSKLLSVTNNHSQSGKLTLNKIKFYELEGDKITPDVDFAYAASDANKNPDYDQDKTDLWGFYKKDYVNSHYVTDVSKDNVDAWSLREINTSMGGKIQIEYEADRYHKEGFADDPDYTPVPNEFMMSPYNIIPVPEKYKPIKTTVPHLIFPIESFNASTLACQMADYDFGPCLNLTGKNDNLPLFVKTSAIINYLDRCTRTALYYNYGNSQIPYTVTAQKLVHRGNAKYTVIPPNTTGPAYTGTGAYGLGYTLSNTYADPFDVDVNLLAQCSATGQFFGSSLDNSGAINFIALFKSYMYGGGIRVKKMNIVEPFKNISYSQEFTYGNGYCPVVPKSMALCYTTAPGNYDVSINYKSMLNSQLNSRVGYDYMITITRSINGETNGSVKQNFINDLIQNPLSFKSTPTMSQQVRSLQVSDWSYILGYCTSYNPINPSGAEHKISTNYMTFHMLLSKGNSALGYLKSSEVFDSSDHLVSQTNYFYTSGSYIEEKNNLSSSFNTIDYYTLIRPIKCAGSNAGFTQYQSSLFNIRQPDMYGYHFTYRFYNSPRLSETITVKDGITFTTKVLDVDPLTGMTKAVRSSDPTSGTVLGATDYAYTSGYTAFDLKSKNENNKNQPALVYRTKAVKNNKYVLSDSYVTYSNVYPTRTYNTTTGKYENISQTKNWYHIQDSYTRLLDDDVLTTATPQSSDYRKTTSATLYDKDGNRIEEEGLNSRKMASKWGYNNRYKLTDIANANYNSFTYTGFEDQLTVNTSPNAIHFGGEVTGGQSRSSTGTYMVNGVPAVLKPHTGKYMATVTIGNTGPEFKTSNFDIGRTYIARVWVHNSSSSNASLSIELTGSTAITVNTFKSDPNNITVGEWTLMTAELTVPSNFNLAQTHAMRVVLANYNGGTSANTAYFDDLSFHPKDAVVTGNVFDEATGLLLAQLDNENFATIYNYDHAGRLINAYKEYSGGTKKLSENSYHNAKP